MTKQVKIMGTTEAGAIEQANNCLEDAEAFCLMADNHQGYGMPIGGVAVYKDKVSPSGVGFDIACGNMAAKLNTTYHDIQDNLSELADVIFNELAFGIGMNNDDAPANHDLFDDPAWEQDLFRENKGIKQVARNQVGTIGSGNHYVDIFVDTDDFIWIGVHFGSRGLGHKIASYYMKQAGDNLNIMNEKPHLLDVNSEIGQNYIAAMNLAGQYAYAGRKWVCETVSDIIGGQIVDSVHNHHNFAWQEKHFGEDYWVVRKGATPAFPMQKGFIGGSMASNAFIVIGTDSQLSKDLFYSTVHGAGRVMSRTKAAGKIRRKKVWMCSNQLTQPFLPDCEHMEDFYNLKQNEPNPQCPECGSKMHKRSVKVLKEKGLVDFGSVKEEMVALGIELRGAGADECPQVYKNLDDVLNYHAGTITRVETLRPIIVCMAGEDIYDPYKD